MINFLLTCFFKIDDRVYNNLLDMGVEMWRLLGLFFLPSSIFKNFREKKLVKSQYFLWLFFLFSVIFKLSLKKNSSNYNIFIILFFRYGCRKVTIVGAILASVGFLLSAFTHHFALLYITFGLISGFGLSLCYVAAVVIGNKY